MGHRPLPLRHINRELAQEWGSREPVPGCEMSMSQVEAKPAELHAGPIQQFIKSNLILSAFSVLGSLFLFPSSLASDHVRSCLDWVLPLTHPGTPPVCPVLMP